MAGPHVVGVDRGPGPVPLSARQTVVQRLPVGGPLRFKSFLTLGPRARLAFGSLVLSLTVALTVAYAWFASLALESRATFDSSVIHSSSIRRGGRLIPWSDLALGSALIGARTRSVAGDVGAFAEGLGGFKAPLTFVVNLDEPMRYSVSGGRVELGAAVLVANGQLAKALLKAWTLQNAGPAIRASGARVETVSDALTAMASGGLRLEDPRTHAVADYPASGSALTWFGALTSMGRACDSGWASMDASELCRAELTKGLSWSGSASETTSRLLVGAMIWRAYRSLSPFGRLAMMASWAAWLREPVGRRQGARPTNLASWRAWLREEFEFVLPPGAFPGDRATSELARLEQTTSLSKDGPPFLDYVARTETAHDLTREASRGGWVGARVGADGAARLFPGDVQLSSEDARTLRARDLVWESCAPPTLGQVVGPARVQRILFVQNCGGGRIDYRPYFKFGGETFARANPKVPFMEMHWPSVEFLLTKRLKQPGDSVLSLVTEREGVLKKSLLPHVARWLDLPRAFRVAGTIEDVVLYRSAEAP